MAKVARASPFRALEAAEPQRQRSPGGPGKARPGAGPGLAFCMGSTYAARRMSDGRANVERIHPGSVRIEGGSLAVGSRRTPLYSGAVHYWRIDRDAWRSALSEVRDLGLPIVETYVPWQVHELSPGEYDFGQRDRQKAVGEFLDLAGELGLLAFIRPGPHINAEMTYFGLPERVVYDRACQARSPRQNPVHQAFPPRIFPVPSYASRNFSQEIGRWFGGVAEVLRPRLYPEGPIVLLQVDNEGSYYFRDAAYDQDYHPDARALWVAFLSARYGSLDAVAEAHRRPYRAWEDVPSPARFAGGQPEDLVIHLDWAAFREDMIARALSTMRGQLNEVGLGRVPTVHNFPLGDQGVVMRSPAIARVVDLVGFDYYHPRREFRTIKRRTLYLAGTHKLPFASEMGVGAPAWFTPLSHEDSLFTLLCSLAYGLRGFNLYMAVDRDRWYGAPIDTQGNPRLEAGAYKQLLAHLKETGFAEMRRPAEVGLMLPAEYARLSKVTSLLGFISPTALEALGGNPFEACREDGLGFEGPVQVLWWRMVARMADALTRAGVPYVYLDGECDPERLASLRVVVTPSFEYCDLPRWKRLTEFAAGGGHIVFGPAMPSMDVTMRRQLFEVPAQARRVLIDTDLDAKAVVDALVDELGLLRPFRVSPYPLETSVHHGAEGPRTLFVINPHKRAHTAHIELPTRLGLIDVLDGDRFEGSDSVEIPMPGWHVRMLSLHGRGLEAHGTPQYGYAS